MNRSMRVAAGVAAAALVMTSGWIGAGCAEQEYNPFQAGCPSVRPRCGDLCVDTALGEACDDGNRLPGDGCSTSCQRESTTDAGDTPPPADDGSTPPRDDAGGTDTGTCPESPCRLKPSCGCGAGEKCTLDFAALSEGSLVKQCGPAGAGSSTSLCTEDPECRPDTICSMLYAESSAELAMCTDICNSSADCVGAGSICVPLLDSPPTPGTCTHACDPVSNAGCPSGTSCQILTLTSTMEDLTECTGDLGSAAPHDSCSAASPCRAGSFCADSDGDTVGDMCIQWCRYPGGACTGGDTCYEFTDSAGTPLPLIIGGTEYGYCYL